MWPFRPSNAVNPADATQAVRIVRMIHELTEGDGETLMFYSPLPWEWPPAERMWRVDYCGQSTNWATKHFTGVTLIEALQRALTHKRGFKCN